VGKEADTGTINPGEPVNLIVLNPEATAEAVRQVKDPVIIIQIVLPTGEKVLIIHANHIAIPADRNLVREDFRAIALHGMEIAHPEMAIEIPAMGTEVPEKEIAIPVTETELQEKETVILVMEIGHREMEIRDPATETELQEKETGLHPMETETHQMETVQILVVTNENMAINPDTELRDRNHLTKNLNRRKPPKTPQ